MVTWIGLYRPAREMGYDRPGGFYGAGAWIIDHAADASLLTELLCEMANQIQGKAMNGDSFIKKIADVRNDFTPPIQVPSILASLTKANSGFKPDGESAFIVEVSNAIDVIEWAQRAQSASYFSKAMLGTADQIPDAGLSSTLRLFASHSLAIEAAYKHMSSEFHSNRSEATSRMNYLSNHIAEKNKEIQELTDNLDDKLKLLKRYETDRMQLEARVGKYSELQIEMEAAQRALSSHKFDDNTLINLQSFVDRDPTMTVNATLDTSSEQHTGAGNGRLASGADPRGQAKLRQPSQVPPSDSENRERLNTKFNFFGNLIFYVVVIFVVLVVALIYGYSNRDIEHGCMIYKLNCQPAPDMPIPKNSITNFDHGPWFSWQPQETGMGSQRP